MTNQIAPMLESINDYYNQPYNEIYRHVIDIAKDARRLDCSTDEDIEKCKWIAAIIDMLFDVAMHNAANILHLNNIKFDYNSYHYRKKNK